MSGGQWHSKTKLRSRGPSGLSPLRSDDSCDGQAGGLTGLTVTKDVQKEELENNSRKTRDLLKIHKA